jgi:hypothetical protein
LIEARLVPLAGRRLARGLGRRARCGAIRSRHLAREQVRDRDRELALLGARGRRGRRRRGERGIGGGGGAVGRPGIGRESPALWPRRPDHRLGVGIAARWGSGRGFRRRRPSLRPRPRPGLPRQGPRRRFRRGRNGPLLRGQSVVALSRRWRSPSPASVTHACSRLIACPRRALAHPNRARSPESRGQPRPAAPPRAAAHRCPRRRALHLPIRDPGGMLSHNRSGGTGPAPSTLSWKTAQDSPDRSRARRSSAAPRA